MYPAALFLYFLFEKSVTVAIHTDVFHTIHSETGFAAAFWIELYGLDFIIGNGGNKRDIMLAAHFVLGGNVIFSVGDFDIYFVLKIGNFSFKRRKRYSVTAYYCFAGGSDDVSANGADVKFGAKHIERAVRVRNIASGKKLYYGDTKGFRKRLNKRNIGISFRCFPFGYGFVAYGELFGKLVLSHFMFLAKPLYHSACNILVHYKNLLYSSIIARFSVNIHLRKVELRILRYPRLRCGR